MRDQTHNEFIENWAKFVRNNPTKWKAIHTRFINSLFDKHKKFIKRIIKQPNGKERIAKIYNIRNIDSYKFDKI